MAPRQTTIAQTEAAIKGVYTLLNSIDNKAIIAYREELQKRYEYATGTDKDYIAFHISCLSALISMKVQYQWYRRLQDQSTL